METARDFEWDSAKSDANLRERGFGFDVATAAFLDSDHLTIDTTRAADGESRQKLIGMIDDKLFAVVFTMRGAITRIISARRANTKEMRIYGNR